MLQVSLAASLSETHRTDKNLTRIGQHEKRNSNSASLLSFCKPNYEEIAQFVLQKRGKCDAGKCSCSVKLALLLSILVWNASCQAQIMSTTPQKIYSSLGDKYCRLCGSEKDVDRSTNVFSKSGIRKNLAKTISELLQVSTKEDDGLSSNICRQCEGKLFGFSEFKSLVINMQSQLKQSVTAKRCKVFSPNLELDQKVRVVENRSSVHSLTFASDKNTNPSQTSQVPYRRRTAIWTALTTF